jgi:hypothetical protein
MVLPEPSKLMTRVRFPYPAHYNGRVAEWLIASVLKTVVRESVPRVRIPPLPPLLCFNPVFRFYNLLQKNQDNVR